MGAVGLTVLEAVLVKGAAVDGGILDVGGVGPLVVGLGAWVVGGGGWVVSGGGGVGLVVAGVGVGVG